MRSFACASGRRTDQFHAGGASLRQRDAASRFSLPFLGLGGLLGPGQPFPPLPTYAWSCSCPRSIVPLGFGGCWHHLSLSYSCIHHQVPSLGFGPALQGCSIASLFHGSFSSSLPSREAWANLGEGISPVVLHNSREKTWSLLWPLIYHNLHEISLHHSFFISYTQGACLPHPPSTVFPCLVQPCQPGRRCKTALQLVLVTATLCYIF